MKMIALESLSATPQSLAELTARLNATGTICRKDVEPYIQHFPITVGLHNFTEDASPKNFGMALEGFAALFSASVNASHTTALDRARKDIRAATLKFSAASANLSDIKEQADFVEKKAHILLLSLPGDALGRLPPSVLRSGLNDTFIPEGNGSSITFNDALQPILNLYETELRGNCSGVINEILAGRNLISGAIYQEIRELFADLARRVQVVGDLIHSADEYVGRGEIEELSTLITQQVVSIRRQKAIARIDNTFDAVLPPRGTVGQMEGDHLDDSGVFDESLRLLSGHFADIDDSSIDIKHLEKASAAINSQSATSLHMKELRAQVRGVVIDADEVRPLQDALDKLREESPDTPLPEGADVALSVFLRTVEADCGALLIVADLFQTELGALAAYIDQYAAAQHNVVDTLALFIKNGEEPGVSVEHREKFFNMLRKLDSGNTVMATEAIGTIIKLVGFGVIIGLVGAAVMKLKKFTSREVSKVRKQVATAVDGFGRAASEIVHELKGGKYGGKTYEAVLTKLKEEGNPPVIEAFTAGEIDYGKETAVSGQPVIVQDFLTGHYSPALDHVGKPFLAVVDDVVDFFKNNVEKDMNALGKDANLSADDLQTPRRYSGSFYTGTGLQRQVEGWAKNADIPTEDMSKFSEAWREKFMAMAKGDKPSRSGYHLDSAISPSAADAVNTLKKKLGAVAEDLEKRLKSLDEKGEVNKNVVAKMREVFDQIRKDIDVLDAIGEVFNLEVDAFNQASKFKGSHTNMILKQVDAAATAVLNNGDSSDQETIDGLNHLRQRMKDISGEAKQSMGLLDRFKK